MLGNRTLKVVSIAVPSLLVVETAVACLFNTTSVTGAGGGRSGSTYTSSEGRGSATATFNSPGQIPKWVSADSGGDSACNEPELFSWFANVAVSHTTSTGERGCGCWNSLHSTIAANGGQVTASVAR